MSKRMSREQEKAMFAKNAGGKEYRKNYGEEDERMRKARERIAHEREWDRKRAIAEEKEEKRRAILKKHEDSKGRLNPKEYFKIEKFNHFDGKKEADVYVGPGDVKQDRVSIIEVPEKDKRGAWHIRLGSTYSDHAEMGAGTTYTEILVKKESEKNQIINLFKKQNIYKTHNAHYYD